jgi:6-phosphofructokinase 2
MRLWPGLSPSKRSIAEATRRAGRQIIIDSSGAPLKAALGAGVYLVKPSLSELRDLLAAALDTQAGLSNRFPPVLELPWSLCN